MESNFFKAALSYHGLAESNASGADLVNDGGPVLLVRIPLTDADLLGILDRMKAMAEQAPAEPQMAFADHVPQTTREQLREEYNTLDKRTRSGFGSFHNYCLARGAGDPFQVTEKAELPAHIYLSPAEATPQQKAMAIGRDEKGNYAIAVEDLTPEQLYRPGGHMVSGGVTGQTTPMSKGESVPTADQLREEYIGRMTAARERLNGADGKPTSNADDLGGLPG